MDISLSELPQDEARYVVVVLSCMSRHFKVNESSLWSCPVVRRSLELGVREDGAKWATDNTKGGSARLCRSGGGAVQVMAVHACIASTRLRTEIGVGIPLSL
jgi:hypothetical protein